MLGVFADHKPITILLIDRFDVASNLNGSLTYLRIIINKIFQLLPAIKQAKPNLIINNPSPATAFNGWHSSVRLYMIFEKTFLILEIFARN